MNQKNVVGEQVTRGIDPGHCTARTTTLGAIVIVVKKDGKALHAALVEERKADVNILNTPRETIGVLEGVLEERNMLVVGTSLIGERNTGL
jgi:hypothetical protein